MGPVDARRWFLGRGEDLHVRRLQFAGWFGASGGPHDHLQLGCCDGAAVSLALSLAEYGHQLQS